MGYSCPVCEDPQADGVHLANHLAFTAMVRGGDHEEYLDEHVPDWAGLTEVELAEELSAVAERVEYPQVFEDTTEGGHSHGHQHNEGGRSDSLPGGASVPDPSVDAETEEVLREARELTRKRRGGADDGEATGEGDDVKSAEEGDNGESDEERDHGESAGEGDGGEPDDSETE